MSERELNQALAMIDAGRLDEARPILQALLKKHPGNGAISNAMGIWHAQKGEFEQAIFFARRTVEAFPGVADPRLNLAQMLSYHAKHAEAAAEFEAALAMDPNNPSAWHRYAAALARAYRYADADKACARGLALAPADHNLLVEQGHIHVMRGRADKAIESLLACLRHHPRSHQAARLLAFAGTYDVRTTPEQAFHAVRLTGELLTAEILRAGQTLPPNAPPSNPDRRIRVGFVSPDFREHAVARFLVGLFTHTDPTRIEWCAYANSLHDDAMTAFFRARCAVFRKITGQGALQIARVIRADSVDVLIDLAGHTAHSAIGLFAHRPAPVQATYLGYPLSVGMPSITHRLVDSTTDPAGDPYDAQTLATERLVRMDPCFLCYTPDAAAPEVVPGPRGRNEPLTFGSFNGYQKIGDEWLAVWARVLNAVPGSRLLIKNYGLNQPEARADLALRLERVGIGADRVTLSGPLADQRSHLAAYGDVDIALDTFPYHGTTTTCEALFMGVPVLTLAGRGHASRVGLSLLSAVGLPDLCASNIDGYVTTVAALAQDADRLNHLRATLRTQMQGSVLMDAPGFAARFERAIRGLWREACGVASPVFTPGDGPVAN